jgi:hypothetical protein
MSRDTSEQHLRLVTDQDRLGNRPAPARGPSTEGWKLTRRGKIALRIGVGLALLAGAAYGLGAGGGPPASYKLPKGLTVTEPYDVSAEAGQLFIDNDVTDEAIGLGQVEFDIDGLATKQRVLNLGALVVKQADGTVDVTLVEGQDKTIAVPSDELAAGPVGFKLIDGAYLTIGLDPNPGADGVDVRLITQPGAAFPEQ